MTRTWRAALMVVVGILAAGAVIGCTGWLTGGSPERILNAVFGGAENVIPTVEKTFRTLWAYMTDALTAFGF